MNPFFAAFEGPVQWLWFATILVVMVLVILSIVIWIKLGWERARRNRRELVKRRWNPWVATALMEDGSDKERWQPPAVLSAELHKPLVKKVLASELVRTHDALRGEMAHAVTRLFQHLQLQSHTRKLFFSRRWHRKAKGIQQATTLKETSLYNAVYRRINHANLYVRNEAQLGMIRLQGAAGLRFLAHLKKPLSDWQQFNLLHQLQLQQVGFIEVAPEWLRSGNSSVVVFAIRLCRVFQCFAMAGHLQQLLEHKSPQVKHEARQCLAYWDIPFTEPAPVAELVAA